MITVIADDLSGAAEAAEQFRLRGHDVIVQLSGGGSSVRPGEGTSGSRSCDVTVVDTDSRELPGPAATAAVATALAGTAGHLVVKKIDSLWRGNVAAEIEALRASGRRVVVAGALPALGRTVVDGHPLVDGSPLHESAHWALEATAAPRSVVEAIGLSVTGAAPVSHVSLAALRADAPGALASALDAADVVVVDGETAADLHAVAAAVAAAPGGRADVALVGTAALAAAVAAVAAPASGPGLGRRGGSSVVAAGGASPAAVTEHPPRRPGHRALVVVGSGAAAVDGQLAELRAAGVPVVALDPRLPASADSEAIAALVEIYGCGSRAALALVSPERVEPRAAVRRLVRIARVLVDADPALDLVVTGGETARALLDLLAVASLRPLGQVEHGAVVSRASDGRLVATKPGSFGGPDVLVALLEHLSALRASRSEPRSDAADAAPADSHDSTSRTDRGDLMTTTDDSSGSTDARPFIAVTMGDAAGVGPEVTVGALLDEAAYRDSRPIVIGDTNRLRMGAAALGVEAEVVEIDDVDEAVFSPGRINVIDPHLISPDLPWGRVSAEAGNAAFHYIRIACELGMANRVQGICTAPLNKAALHEAGHIYPGHTELLAHFMGVGEVSMMLSTPKIKVIHVTTHIGLIDAIAKIEPGLVERTVRRGWEALRRAGVDDPIIGVCAINPHAGENGLFGYGEEAEKITPAIELLQAEGMRVAGPLPADTAFFLGGRGDYDLIVAMYHDQGHGPVKVLGIEAGVNITVGLPVIRTSVDHGTAFDIAGTGKVAVGSMIEALRQAVEMSPSPAAAAAVAASTAAAPAAASASATAAAASALA